MSALSDEKILDLSNLKAFVILPSKKDLKGIVKSINPGCPAQSTQADHGQNFLLLADFLCIK